jgi:ERCC4-related helicase
VNQQIDACYNVVGIPESETCELTGKSVAKAKRMQLWNSKRVFFATPQVIQNDISDNNFPVSAIKLIIVDEVRIYEQQQDVTNIIINTIF